MTASQSANEGAILLDTSIAAYALGDEHPLKEPCRRLLRLTATATLRGYSSVEMIQELVHHRLRRTGDRRLAALDGRDIAAATTVLPFDREVLDLALDLIERTSIRGRDAVHAATAIVYGIGLIASTDTAFDTVPGITRLDPLSLT